MNKNIFIIIVSVVVVAGIGAGGYFYNNYQSLIGSKKDLTLPASRVIMVNPGGPAFANFFDGFQDRLKIIYGEAEKEITFISFDAGGSSEKLKELISKAVEEKPDLIVTISGPPTFQALKETNSIPILTAIGDPVEHGYIKSIQSSETNLTGIAQQNIELTPKRFELLKEMIPSVKRVAVFYDTTCGPTKKARPVANVLAPGLGLTLTEFPVTMPTKEKLAEALKNVTKKNFDALIFYPHGTLFSKSDLFLKKAGEEKLPIIMPDEESLQGGAIASYGPSYYEMGVQLARLARKVLLQGIHPKDIPFEQPSKIEFVISLSNAEKLGITIPPEILSRADKIIK